MPIELLIPGADLVDHFAKREKYHLEKAKVYKAQAAQSESLRAGAEMHMSGDPVQQLRASANMHQEKATYFSLLAKYVIKDKTHTVTMEDMIELEFSARIARW